MGLRGEREDGGARAGEALAAGAWGVLVAPEHASGRARRASAAAGRCSRTPTRCAACSGSPAPGGASSARAGRAVVAITGSTGKTSTKDILAALLGRRDAHGREPGRTSTPRSACRWRSSRRPPTTRALVLEMAMRGPGQIAELTAIAEPDVGVIVNVGPAHLELLGSLEAIAAAKAELIAGLRPGAVAVVPGGRAAARAAPARRPAHDHLRRGRATCALLGRASRTGVRQDRRRAASEIELLPSFAQAHNLRNLLAAVAAARALGVRPAGALEVRVLGDARPARASWPRACC